MRMSFSWTSFIVISFCLSSIVVQSSGELVLLHHPLNDDKSTKKLTCMSEDDDAALIWNANFAYNGVQNHLTDFQPGKPTKEIIAECAIRNLTECLASWKNPEGWDTVNSAMRPMAPVSDYRWEVFKEFLFTERIEEGEHKYVGEVNGSAGAAVFSVRGSRDAYVLLCTEREPVSGPCFWIILAGWKREKSAIRTCDSKGPPDKEDLTAGSCETVTSTEHKARDVIDTLEWRTFVFKWDGDKKVIQIFNDTGHKLFFEVNVGRWHNVSHMSIRSDLKTRFRFHFYHYFVTTKNNTTISTTEFDHPDRNFCVNLLVGLCPECILEVNLVDSKGHNIKIGNISGGEDDAGNGLPAWRSVKLNANLQRSDPRFVRLTMTTILNENQGEGRWAIDTFRMCESVDRLRESTVTIRWDESSWSWPEVKCQKLFYNESTIVDSVSKKIIATSTTQLEEFLRKRDRVSESRGPEFGKSWFICNPTVCTCDRGFTGRACDKEIKPPIVVNITDTTATVIQDIELEENKKDSVVIQGIIATFMKSGTNFTVNLARSGSSSTYETQVKDLEMNTVYRVHAVVLMKLEEDTIRVLSREIRFSTTCYGKPLFSVIPNETSLQVTKRSEAEKCQDLDGPHYFLHLYNASGTPIGNLTTHPEFPYLYSNLSPYTKYKVIASGDDSLENISLTTEIRTLESAPSGVEKLKVTFTSATNVTLQWDTPSSENGIIRNYNVTLKLDNLLGCKDLNRPTPPHAEIVRTVNDTTVPIGDLHPYAIYTAIVAAQTTKWGPNETVTCMTEQTDIPTSKVENLRTDDAKSQLIWNDPLDCTTITGATKITKLHITGVSDSVRNGTFWGQTEFSYFNLISLDLVPYAWYRVRAYIVRDYNKTENSDFYQVFTWRTPPTAPPPVTKLELYEADLDTNTVCLRWIPPYPADGEIESYRVSIVRSKNQNLMDPIVISKEGLNCRLWKDYVCLENVTVPRNIRTSDMKIQVSAMNKNVTKPGEPSVIPITQDLYNKAPNAPLNLTSTSLGFGIVKLNWTLPSFNPTKITGFDIHVQFVSTDLKLNPINQPVGTQTCLVKPNQTEYSLDLSLLTSTTYNVSIAAVNRRNRQSANLMKTIQVPRGVAFTSEEKPKVTQHESSIEIIVPTVVNATTETRVRIIARGSSTCIDEDRQKSKTMEWLAAVYKVEDNRPKSIRIGIDHNKDVVRNCSLRLGETYVLVLVLEDKKSLISPNLTSSAITLREIEQASKSNLAWLVIFPLLAICVVIWFVRQRNCKNVTSSEENISSRQNLIMLSKPKDPIPRTDPMDIGPITTQQSAPDVIPYNPLSVPVEMEKFEEYTRDAVANGLLDSQYGMFTRGLTKQCEYGKLPENKSKNRYKNLVAYDDTRVILQKIPGDPYSDYINASYIPGYLNEKAYIATQGPMPSTVKDFWRMVWQENVHVICMLANVTERGKTKCEKYWPEKGAKMKYGDVYVSNTNQQVTVNYTFRTFILSFGKKKREVTHLHYTGWPDHAVPLFTESIIPYLKKLLDMSTENGPFVVHCSAGIGRTGTIILCDTCLRQAREEKMVNLPAVTVNMRKHRVNMVENQQQYLFAHLAILETEVSNQTQIPCDDLLTKKIKKMKMKLPFDIKRLKDSVWQDRAFDFLDEQTGEISVKSGEAQFGLPQTSDSEEGNHTSTMSIDGVTRKNQYLVARLPTRSTRSDLWKLIAEEQIELVIILQRPDSEDPIRCDIMSHEWNLISVPPHIEVEAKASIDEEHFAINKFTLTDTSQGEARLQPVTMLTCRGWGCGIEGKPPMPTELVSLWTASEKISRKETPVMLLCYDGVTGCGLYLALSFLLERMAVDRECDVISAVRAVRRFRREFVQSLEQFEYLYDAAVCYDQCFTIYANFS